MLNRDINSPVPLKRDLQDLRGSGQRSATLTQIQPQLRNQTLCHCSKKRSQQQSAIVSCSLLQNYPTVHSHTSLCAWHVCTTFKLTQPSNCFWHPSAFHGMPNSWFRLPELELNISKKWYFTHKQPQNIYSNCSSTWGSPVTLIKSDYAVNVWTWY